MADVRRSGSSQSQPASARHALNSTGVDVRIAKPECFWPIPSLPVALRFVVAQRGLPDFGWCCKPSELLSTAVFSCERTMYPFCRRFRYRHRHHDDRCSAMRAGEGMRAAAAPPSSTARPSRPSRASATPSCASASTAWTTRWRTPSCSSRATISRYVHVYISFVLLALPLKGVRSLSREMDPRFVGDGGGGDPTRNCTEYMRQHSRGVPAVRACLSLFSFLWVLFRPSPRCERTLSFQAFPRTLFCLCPCSPRPRARALAANRVVFQSYPCTSFCLCPCSPPPAHVLCFVLSCARCTRAGPMFSGGTGLSRGLRAGWECRRALGGRGMRTGSRGTSASS